ncbi:hypothetical protein AB0J52_24650, partial [Spirillospora sp. NPDC049652]
DGLLVKNPTRRLTHARAADRLERALNGPRSARRAAPAAPRLRLMVVIALVSATVASCGIGAAALIFGMTKEKPGPSPTRPPKTSGERPASGTPSGAESATLLVRAREDGCKLFVSVPAPKLTVIADETLAKGDARKYSQPKLTAVVGNAAACDVWVNGQRKPEGRPGERRTYNVARPAGG